MKQRPDHRLTRSLNRLTRAFRRLHILRYRFGYGEEHQVDTDPGSKQHRRPTQQTEFRFGLFWPELHRTKTRTSDTDHKDNIERCRQQIVPTEGFRNPVQRAANPQGREVAKQDRCQGKQQNQSGGGVKHHRIDFVLFPAV